MEGKGIRVEVTYTDGYEKRFTEACLNQISKRGSADADQEDDHKRKTA